jgi:hypothetical protein
MTELQQIIRLIEKINVLESKMHNTDDLTKKEILEDMANYSRNLSKISQTLSDQIRQNIINNCAHVYEPDRWILDPCRTYYICNKCTHSK